MKKILSALLFFAFFYTFAQVHLDYPPKQDFYKGGYQQFYTELRDVILNKEGRCEANEALFVKVIVEPDATVKYVFEPDTVAVSKNKCSSDLIKKALTELKGWIPAEFSGEKERAIARFIFSPNELLEPQLYNSSEYKFVKAEFPGGIEKFRKRFINCVDLRRFSADGKINFVLDFEVNTQGKIQNLFFDTKISNVDFTKMVFNCLNTNKIWKTGSYNGTPIVTRFKMPIVVNFE